MLLIPLILLMVHAHAACNLNVLVALDRTFIHPDPTEEGKDARALLHGALAQANFSALHMSVLELKHNKFNWLHAPRTYTRAEREEALGAIMDARAGVRARGVQFAPIFRGFLKYHAPFDAGHRRVILLASDFRYDARTLRAGARAKYWLTRTLGRRHAPVVVCLRTSQARATRAERALCDKVFYEGRRATLQEVLWGASRIMCPVVDVRFVRSYGPIHLIFSDDRVRSYTRERGIPLIVNDTTLEDLSCDECVDGRRLTYSATPNSTIDCGRQYSGYFRISTSLTNKQSIKWHRPESPHRRFVIPQRKKFGFVKKCVTTDGACILEESGRITTYKTRYRGGRFCIRRTCPYSKMLFEDVFPFSGNGLAGVLYDGTFIAWGQAIGSVTFPKQWGGDVYWW